MSEFRKPFEYVEEKGLGGLLLFLFVMLPSVEVPLTLAVTIQAYSLLGGVPCLGPAVLAIGIATLAFLLVAAIALRRLSRHAIGIAKSFLVVRALVLAPAFVLIFSRFSTNPRMLSWFRTRGNLVAFGLVIPLAYAVLFSGLWFAYLARSRRVRQLEQTLADQRGHRPASSPD